MHNKQHHCLTFLHKAHLSWRDNIIPIVMTAWVKPWQNCARPAFIGTPAPSLCTLGIACSSGCVW
jgi:hypothetical protein